MNGDTYLVFPHGQVWWPWNDLL